MNIQKIFSGQPDSPIMEQAAETLRAGGLVAFPTETVYGLGADAGNDSAVAGIFAAKGRPSFNPLIVHVSDVAMAEHYATFSPLARKLAAAFWPGPLALVLPRRADAPLSHLATAGLDTVALRAPAHPIARALLEAFGSGIAAPSANRSGRVSPTLASHVAEEFANSDMTILDGGACDVGVESTVLDLSGDAPTILRPGAITAEEIERSVGIPPLLGEGRVGLAQREEQPPPLSSPTGGGRPKSPGQLEQHYAPLLPVRLNVTSPQSGEALIAFGSSVPSGAKKTINLSARGDVNEAAANLYATLRMLDNPMFSAIAVMPIPEEGLGIAINDRLRRAAQRE